MAWVAIWFSVGGPALLILSIVLFVFILRSFLHDILTEGEWGIPDLILLAWVICILAAMILPLIAIPLAGMALRRSSQLGEPRGLASLALALSSIIAFFTILLYVIVIVSI